MKHVSLFGALALIASPLLFAINGTDVECQAEISWPDHDSRGLRVTRSEGETLSLSLLKKPTDQTAQIRGHFEANEEVLGYSLEIDKTTHVVELKVRNSLVRTQLDEGEQIAWSRGDSDGGASMTVRCIRGGSHHVDRETRFVVCAGASIKIGGPIGFRPRAPRYQYLGKHVFSGGSNANTVSFGEWGLSFTGLFEKSAGTLEVGPNIFDLSIRPGKSFEVRSSMSDGGYDAIVCRAR